MEPDLIQTISLLARMPATFNALLRDLPECWIHRNEGENTWTAFEVVGHLVNTERNNWIPRARIILEHGETRTFEPLDREPQLRDKGSKSLKELLDEFARLRAENLAALQALKLLPQDLDRRGRHPSFGTVTLYQLLATWAAHDMTHLHQISRVFAHQYCEDVGPWIKFLGVLKCAGHSSPA